MALGAMAQETTLPKAFSFTVESDGETPALISSITTDSVGTNMVQIDWGNGELTDPFAIEDYYTTWTPTEFVGIPTGNTVTVYADPKVINYLDASWATGYLKWTSVDVSALTEIHDLYVTSNALTEIDLSTCTKIKKIDASSNDIQGEIDFSNNTELTTVNFSNTETNGTNNIAGSDFSCLKAVTTLNLSYNQHDKLNVAGLSALKTLNITGCHLTEIDLAGCSAIATFNGNYNDFETIDISQCGTNKAYYYINNCKLSSITLAESYTGKGRMQLTNNCFTFATLPSRDFLSTYTYTYAPQANIEVVPEGNTVDLTEYMPVIGENATIANWANGDVLLNEGVDYTVDGCVFTFLNSFDNLNVALTNDAFPGLTIESDEFAIATTGIVDINAADTNAVYYNLNGQQVKANAPGLYIRKVGNKAVKVIVK